MSNEADATYSGDPSASDLDAVRFLIGDTDVSNLILTDSEVNFLLTEEGNKYSAASRAALSMAATFGRKADKSVGDLSIRYSDRRQHYLELATKLADHASMKGSALTGITGGRGSERDPMFWLGMQRMPGTPVTSYSTSSGSLESFSVTYGSTYYGAGST